MNVAAPLVRARAFDAWADDYERYRPTYPAGLFDLIVERFGLADAPDAVDLGAGTGKVARAAAARGWRVTAVEPGARLLDVLRRTARAEGLTITAVEATAEATGLPDAAFDVALAGEAWHWFDASPTLAELARIVRPGGGVALFWNVVNEADSPLVAAEREVVDRYGLDASGIRTPGPNPETRDALRAANGFEEPAFAQLSHVVPMTGEGYLGWTATKSHLRTQPADVQHRYLRDLRAALGAHGIGASDEIQVPFTIDCWLAARSAS